MPKATQAECMSGSGDCGPILNALVNRSRCKLRELSCHMDGPSGHHFWPHKRIAMRQRTSYPKPFKTQVVQECLQRPGRRHRRRRMASRSCLVRLITECTLIMKER
jgi:hypothetical protein